MTNLQDNAAKTRKPPRWASLCVACVLAAVLVAPTTVAVSMGIFPGAEERQHEHRDPLICLHQGGWLGQRWDLFVCSMVVGFGGGPLQLGPLRPGFTFQGAFAPHCHHLAAAPLRN